MWKTVTNEDFGRMAGNYSLSFSGNVSREVKKFLLCVMCEWRLHTYYTYVGILIWVTELYLSHNTEIIYVPTYVHTFPDLKRSRSINFNFNCCLNFERKECSRQLNIKIYYIIPKLLRFVNISQKSGKNISRFHSKCCSSITINNHYIWFQGDRQFLSRKGS
jgi:hypothetical protein